MSQRINIREGNIQEAFDFTAQIPEFAFNPYPIQKYYDRLTSDIPHLIVVAEIDQTLIGYKVGYDRDLDGKRFYSWLGAVLPDYRYMGIAKKMADYQEIWASKQGYTHVYFRTRNRFKSMLIFAIKNGFNIIDFEQRVGLLDYRITLQKELDL